MKKMLLIIYCKLILIIGIVFVDSGFVLPTLLSSNDTLTVIIGVVDIIVIFPMAAFLIKDAIINLNIVLNKMENKKK